MIIRDLYNVIDSNNINKFIIMPKTQAILGVMPSSDRFIAIRTSDKDRLSQILDVEIEQISIFDNLMYITI